MCGRECQVHRLRIPSRGPGPGPVVSSASLFARTLDLGVLSGSL
jgi:hypothetical protein